jgi:hypothetical protein
MRRRGDVLARCDLGTSCGAEHDSDSLEILGETVFAVRRGRHVGAGDLS